MSIGLTGRLAHAAAAHPWRTIGGWLVLVAASLVASGNLDASLSQEDRALTTTQSQQASDLIMQLRGDQPAGPDVETIVVISDTHPYSSAEFTATLADTVGAIGKVEGVDTITTPDVSPDTSVAASGMSALISVTLSGDHPDSTGAHLNDAIDAVDHPGFTVVAFGEATASDAYDTLASDTLARGEMVGIGIALIVLVVVFGALVAATIPLLIGGVSIAAALGATVLVSGVFDLSFFIVNMITMMGLALGIDYSLVIVQRFREHLAQGATVPDAVTAAGATASRAVLISGATVLVSLAGMLIVPSTIMVSLGMGAMLVAVFAVLAALTLLPAILSLLGHRVGKGRVPTAHPGSPSRVWARVARTVLRRPLMGVMAGLAILVTLAIPALSMRLAFPGTEALPEQLGFRQAITTLVADYRYGQSSTVIAIEHVGQARPQVQALADAIEASDAFTETTVEFVADGAIIDTKDVYDSASTEAERAVRDLREHLVPDYLGSTDAVAYVGGDQAQAVDFSHLISTSAPWVALIVLGASLVVLLVTFRSLVLAVTAIVLNVVSTAAAYGVLVAVFQFGWGAHLLSVPQVGSIAPWIPVLLFAVLFGLSMDYHVFLLSRIAERHSRDGDTRAAIVHGLSHTGSLITGAALIMVAVFAGFALGDLAEFSQMGVGLAVAVILDATVVRSVLVPAVMGLLGTTNWYLPRWLRWLPHLRIEADLDGPEAFGDLPDGTGRGLEGDALSVVERDVDAVLHA